MTPGRAVVIGGSIGGLFAALYLQREGWQVQVFERVSQGLDGRGAGIVTHPELFDALSGVGIDPYNDVGITVAGRIALAADGKVLASVDLKQVMTAWGRVYQLLLQRFGNKHYHQGKMYTHAQQDEHGITAFFEDGSSYCADLLIGADGFRSNVREQFEPQCQPQYAGYVCWRGLVDERAFSARTHAEIFEHFAFSLPRSEQALGYPVAGDGNVMSKGLRRYNLVWYRPADQASTLADLLTDVDGQMNGVSIAPNRIRPEVLAQLRHDADRLLAPQFSEAFALCEQPFIQPIYDLNIGSMVYGRVVIIGDAAFVARPHVGMGVTKAASDARVLAQHLAQADSVTAALTQFSDERHRLGAFVVQRARDLGAYMQAQIKTADERRKAEAFRTPQVVMTQTATTDFLADFR